MSDCLFCAIVTGQIPATVVYDSDTVLAFRDIAPQAPVHIIIVPKAHIGSIRDLTADHGPVLAAITAAANAIADAEGIGQRGYRVVVNYGPESGHSVWHLHYHLLGGALLGNFGVPRDYGLGAG